MTAALRVEVLLTINSSNNNNGNSNNADDNSNTYNTNATDNDYPVEVHDALHGEREARAGLEEQVFLADRRKAHII